MKKLKNQEKAEKIEKYTEKKRDMTVINNILSGFYEKNGNERKSERLKNCASYLMFRNYQNPEKTKKLLAASFCKHPLCLMCEWRLHLRKIRELETAIKLMRKSDSAYRFYFLTLTVKNWHDISNTKLKDLQHKAVKFVREVIKSKSYYMSTEITISAQGDYHPHIHAIVSTECDYNVDYNVISTYRRLWCLMYGEQDFDFLEVTYYPITPNSISEVTKYVLKPECKPDERKILDIAIAVHGLRKTFASGDIREYIKKAKNEIKGDCDTENATLNNYNYYDELYSWLGNKYLLNEL